ncbi:MAG: hypothetical protein AAFP90_14395 [Planctomycetota bacterium]
MPLFTESLDSVCNWSTESLDDVRYGVTVVIGGRGGYGVPNPQ